MNSLKCCCTQSYYLVLFLLFCSFVPVQAGKFIVDFDQPNGKPRPIPIDGGLEWQELQGKWTVKNKKYVQSETEWTSVANCTTYHRSHIGNENWTDYTVSATVRIDEGGPLAPIAGLFFRVNGDNPKKGDMECNYYYFRIDQRAAEGPCLIKSPNEILKIHKAKPCKLKTDYILKVAVKGSSIKCFINDKLEFDVEDKSFPKGAVGVGTFNAGVSFDNLTVEGPEIPQPVDLKNKLTTTWANCKIRFQ